VDAPILRVVAQKYEGDCAVACLATLFELTYEDALVALSQEEPGVVHGGVTERALRRAAKVCGRELKRQRRIDLEDSTGILWLESPHWPAAHVVVLWDGRIIDTDGAALWREADDYLKHYEATPKALLIVQD
jgi:hypothetical protein